MIALLCALPAMAATLSALPLLMHTAPLRWPGPAGLGGAIGQSLARIALRAGHDMLGVAGAPVAWVLCAMLAVVLSPLSLALSAGEWRAAGRGARRAAGYSTRPGLRFGSQDETTPTRQARSARVSRTGLARLGIGLPAWLGMRRPVVSGAAGLFDDDLLDRASPGPSPFAARGRDAGPSGGIGAGHNALARREPVRVAGGGFLAEQRPRPAGAEPAAPAPKAGSSMQNGGGYMLPPGAGDEHDEVPILPLRSAAARAAARRGRQCHDTGHPLRTGRPGAGRRPASQSANRRPRARVR